MTRRERRPRDDGGAQEAAVRRRRERGRRATAARERPLPITVGAHDRRARGGRRQGAVIGEHTRAAAVARFSCSMALPAGL